MVIVLTAPLTNGTDAEAPAMVFSATATIERSDHCPVWLSACASFNWQFSFAMLKLFAVFCLNDFLILIF